MEQQNGRLNILTPLARLVQGSLTQKVTTDYFDKPLDHVEYFIAISIPSHTKEGAEFRQKIWDFGRDNLQKFWESTDFNWKMNDGNDPKYEGKDGFKGCTIYKLKTRFAIQTVDNTGQVLPHSRIKLGDYVFVQISVAANLTQNKEGIYLNPEWVSLQQEGEAIISGPSPAAALAERAAGGPPGNRHTQVPNGGPPGYRHTQATGTVADAVPDRSFGQPPVKTIVLTPKAGNATIEEFRAKKWTDDEMIKQGYAVYVDSVDVPY